MAQFKMSHPPLSVTLSVTLSIHSFVCPKLYLCVCPRDRSIVLTDTYVSVLVLVRKKVFEPYPDPKNSPAGPQKADVDPKIKSKPKVRIERTIENKSCSPTPTDRPTQPPL